MNETTQQLWVISNTQWVCVCVSICFFVCYFVVSSERNTKSPKLHASIFLQRQQIKATNQHNSRQRDTTVDTCCRHGSLLIGQNGKRNRKETRNKWKQHFLPRPISIDLCRRQETFQFEVYVNVMCSYLICCVLWSVVETRGKTTIWRIEQ